MQLGKTYRNNIFSLTRSQNHIFSLQYTHTHTWTQYISFSSMSTFWIYWPWNIFSVPGMVFHEVILVLTKKPNKCIIKLMINYIIKDKFIYIYIHYLNHICFFLYLSLGFPCGSAGKESACSAGDLGSPFISVFQTWHLNSFLQLKSTWKAEVWRVTWEWKCDTVNDVILWFQRSLGFSIW